MVGRKLVKARPRSIHELRDPSKVEVLSPRDLAVFWIMAVVVAAVLLLMTQTVI
jgi:hypothetical protein